MSRKSDREFFKLGIVFCRYDERFCHTVFKERRKMPIIESGTSANRHSFARTCYVIKAELRIGAAYKFGNIHSEL